jgi:CheY-like chemotaxis protein
MSAASERNDRVGLALDELVARAESEGATELRDDLAKMRGASQNLAEQLESLARRAAAARGGDALREIRHDMRTPINQIKGYCELLQEEVEDAGIAEAWAQPLLEIHEETEALQADVEELAAKVTGASTVRGRRRHSTPMQMASVAPRRPDKGERGTVLVVDDHAVNRELLARVLHRDGYAVRSAADGRRGIEELCREDAAPIDIVLLDILMPEMDGYETLERMKADEDLRHIPVIMLTSLDEHSSITRCIEAGAEDHLPKPFDPVLLRARLDSSLERKRSRDRERSYLAQIVAAKKRADDLLHGVIPLGVALSGEREEAKLLERVLGEARRFCGADGGVLYLREGQTLVPMQVQVASLDLEGMGADTGVTSETLGVQGGVALSPVATAASFGRTVCLTREGANGDPLYDLSGTDRFDQTHDYSTRSVLCLPLRAKEDVVGVLELWNATRPIDGATADFEPDTVEVLESLSLLAAAALDVYRRENELRQQIRRLEIRVDEAKQREEVSEITETDYFKRLREEARRLRKGPG